ncbi:MAG: Response regulator containing a CheY-like receiver domain and an DNA-binding domain [Actinobacteria bacterium]|nr:Response regulator containing a CheY-like receiver domain and an DNA-binding domain [Bryobacterales bacterium]MCW3044948.1 Response regulator containing a CheY-like receiver domain and an DNA-binding domain [Actinomycetota bacterium]
MALDRASAPLAIVDGASLRVEAANAAFAELVGVSLSRVAGMSLLSFMPASELDAVTGVFKGMTSGFVSLSLCRGTWGRPPHDVEVAWWIQPLAEAAPGRLALYGVATSGAVPRLVPLPGEEAFVPGDVAMTHVGLDHHWRMEEIALNAEILLGWRRSELLGTPIQARVHPDDIPTMLLVLGRASAETGGVAAPLRIRNGDGGFKTLGFAASPLCEHNPPRFVVALWVFSTDGQGQISGIDAARLGRQLWAISMEGHAARAEEGRYSFMHPAPRALSVRQLEITRRLAAGERVPTIARGLGISGSTVRNHLAAIYRKVGVHSQAELLALLMRKGPPTR